MRPQYHAPEKLVRSLIRIFMLKTHGMGLKKKQKKLVSFLILWQHAQWTGSVGNNSQKIEFAYIEIEFQKPTLRNLLCGDYYPQSSIFVSELWLLSAQLASLLNLVHCFPMPILHFIQPWGLLCISISVPPLPVLGNLSNVQLHIAVALKTDSTVNDSTSQNSTSVSFTQWISFSGLSCK